MSQGFESLAVVRLVQDVRRAICLSPVKLYQLKLVVYDPEKEVVVEWKD
jgi:hypothetical protein